MPKSNLEIIQSTYEGSASCKAFSRSFSLKSGMDRGRRFPVRRKGGVEAIMENVFSRLGSDWDDYKASVNIS